MLSSFSKTRAKHKYITRDIQFHLSNDPPEKKKIKSEATKSIGTELEEIERLMVVALKESIMGTMKVMMQGDDNHGGRSVVLEGGEVIVGEGEVLEEEEEDGVELPGFRFHPTDEELVTFYLRRKVAGKRLSIEIIKEMDIYKHEPSDLPKTSTVGGGDKEEWYFFCLRGRKYRNSVRPNRVTGTGFWKATGIDRPIHGSAGIVGLKKSLVYYRGSAGKGVKTEWMMHEFRLPPNTAVNSSPCFEAEVWTICRIFKRSIIYKKHPQQQQHHIAATPPPQQQDSSSGVTGCGSLDSSECTGEYGGNYEYTMNNNCMPAPAPVSGGAAYYGGVQQQYFHQGMQWNDGGAMQQPAAAVSDGDVWDDDIGRMVMELTDPSVFYDCRYA